MWVKAVIKGSKMIILSKVLYILFSIWYWLGEGATEGYTWASKKRRINNWFIKPGIHDNSNHKNAKGKYCYHTWRVLGENIGILGIAVFSVLMGKFGITGLDFVIITIGATLVGVFFYERVFNHISYNKWFPQKAAWDFLNGKVIIPRRPWHDWIILSLGILILIFL